jgi:hypothetical protein
MNTYVEYVLYAHNQKLDSSTNLDYIRNRKADWDLTYNFDCIIHKCIYQGSDILQAVLVAEEIVF